MMRSRFASLKLLLSILEGTICQCGSESSKKAFHFFAKFSQVEFQLCVCAGAADSTCLWRPEVSTMMRSRFSSLNLSTPSSAMAAGSVSV